MTLLAADGRARVGVHCVRATSYSPAAEAEHAAVTRMTVATPIQGEAWRRVVGLRGRPQSWRYTLLALGVAAAHAFAFLSVSGNLIARADRLHRAPPAPVLEAAAAVLGAPLFYLPESWLRSLRPVLGDDSTILFAQAGANGLQWGDAIAAAIFFARIRRRLDVGRRHAAS